MPDKPIHPFLVIAFVLVIVAGGVLQGFSNRNYYLDDAFIFLRVGQNLADGDGPVFNAGERVNCSTSFLNPLQAALAHLICSGNEIFFMHLINEVCLILAAVLILYLFSLKGGAAAGFIAALALLVDPLIRQTYGMESALLALCVISSVLCLERESRLAGFFMGAAVLARPDAIVLAGLGLTYLLIKKRRLPWSQAAAVFLMVGAWLLFSYLYFGSLLPQTLTAKMAQGSSAYWKKEILFLPGLVSQFQQMYPGPWSVVILAAVPLGVLRLHQAKSPLLLVFPWAAIHVIAYAGLGVPGYHWYYVPVVLALKVAAGGSAWWIFRAIKSRLQSRLKRPGFLPSLLAGAASMVVLFPLIQAAPRAWGLGLPPREAAYREVGTWLRDNTRPEETIAAAEIGTIAYYSQRRVVDPLGLVANPAMVKDLQKGYEQDWVSRAKPNVIVIHQKIWPIEKAWMSARMEQDYLLWKLFEFPQYRNLLALRRKPA